MLSRLAIATACAFFACAASAQAAPGVTYSDAVGDIASGIATGNGTLDITGMEVSNTSTDIIFKLTVNGNVSTTDWGKFMIGIANGSAGSSSSDGWGRPIYMSSANGMTNWIGSWVDGGGGAENRNFASGWGLAGATYNGNFGSYSIASGATSTMTYTVSLASLGLSNGSTFFFDAYSSGGGSGDSAVDALANPNPSISNWGDVYTSAAPNVYSYTVVPAPGAFALLGLAGLGATRRARKA